jgi:gamma-glutamylcyclotransferase (GGCT)/AIG2-like uncharacterized protein YtfP
VNGIGGRRAAGQKDVHRHKLVKGAHHLEQLGHHDAGNLRLRVGVLDVGPVENRLGAEGIAHGRHVARDRAVAQGDQQLGVGAHLPDLLFVVHRGYGSLDQGDVHLVGKLLGVHQGAVDHFDQLSQREDTLVHVEKRHVTAGTSVEPYCCNFQFAHCASLMRFR